MPSTNFRNYYWSVATKPGYVFSSASATYVPTTDTTYETWTALGYVPAQAATEQALLQVLAGVCPGLVAQFPAGLIAYAQSKQQAIAVGGITVNVGTVGSALNIEASTDTSSLIMVQGAATLAQAAPTQTFTWVQNNGASVSLTAAQVTQIFGAVATFIQSTFTQLSQVVAAISAGTITTRAQVDSPPSPVPAWPVNS
jgi:Domain of unknown function (DUF4376)